MSDATMKSDADTRTVVFCIEALTVGGAEQMLVAMANQFVGRGWRVHMVCLTKEGELASRLRSEVELHVLHKKPGVDLKLPRKLRALVQGINPNAVNSHLWTANLWTRIALARTGIPVVATEHSRDSWKPGHYRLLDRLLINVTSQLVAVSTDTAEFYTNTINIPADKVTVINNGIDTKRYAAGTGEALKQRWKKEHELLIGTVGRMVPAKNHLRLLEVASILKNKRLEFKLVLVGDGELRGSIEAAIDDKGLSDCVHLAGARSDIPDVLSALDIFVLSSDREGHPLTALEAQAAGTPVVLTNAGGSSDAIAKEGDKAGGILVDLDANAIADAIVSMAEDRTQLVAMGQFAQAHALEHFDLGRMVDRYEALLS